MPFQSTKTFGHEVGLSCAFRQWRATSHCRFVHGYALAIKLVFQTDQLDANGWVMDFGAFQRLKNWLQETFDHKLLVATDDPDLGAFRVLHDKGLADVVEIPRVGCEAFAQHIAKFTLEWMFGSGTFSRVQLVSVTVSEHGANSATFMPSPFLIPAPAPQSLY